MTPQQIGVLHHLIRQTAIVVCAGGLVVALILRALSESTFAVLFALVVTGKVVEHFRRAPLEARLSEVLPSDRRPL
jgi:hypothetical protein